MKRALSLLSICAFAAVLFFQRQALLRLKQQNAMLLQQVASSTGTTAVLKSNTLNHETYEPRPSRELLRLRNEIALLRRETNALGQQLTKKGQGQTLRAQEQPIAANSWAFCGYATPQAAVESTAWAMLNGNLDVYMASLAPEARQKATEQFSGKSQKEIKTMLLDVIAGARALRPDRQSVYEDGSIGFPISSVTVDDGVNVSTMEKVLRFVSVSGEWKLAQW